MISILEKIGKAICHSRHLSDLVITEDQQVSIHKLFISATMDSESLDLWGEIVDVHAEDLKIVFIDESRDVIHPREGVPGQRHYITITYNEIPGILRLFTLEGWRTFLLQDSKLCRYKHIYGLFITEGFQTISWYVHPWKEIQPLSAGDATAITKPSVTKSIIKCYSTTFLPPDAIAPWILETCSEKTDEAIKIWKLLGCRELLKCFANELFFADEMMVGLAGKPPRKIAFGDETAALPAFDIIQEAAKWIFLEGNETELKHTFLSSELAREWPSDLNFCEGVMLRLSSALESARLMYKAHIRTGGKDTMKSLGDLRKTLAEDTQKIIQQSRDLSSSLWKDMALVISVLVIRYSLDAVKSVGLQNIYALVFCAIAVYIVISYGMSVYINRQTISLLERVRTTWRTKLYGFLDEQDYQELARKPVKDAMGSYCRVERMTSTVVILLVVILLIAACSEFWSISTFYRSVHAWFSELASPL